MDPWPLRQFPVGFADRERQFLHDRLAGTRVVCPQNNFSTKFILDRASKPVSSNIDFGVCDLSPYPTESCVRPGNVSATFAQNLVR